MSPNLENIGISRLRLSLAKVNSPTCRRLDRATILDESGHIKTATVLKLKASLSEYLRQVKAGEEVLVTERGRPIAKLTPAVGSSALTQELVEMEKQGLVKIGRGKLPKDFWDLPRPTDPKGRVSQSLIQEREQGR
jgi:prevent-host-death family protein